MGESVSRALLFNENHFNSPAEKDAKHLSVKRRTGAEHNSGAGAESLHNNPICAAAAEGLRVVHLFSF